MGGIRKIICLVRCTGNLAANRIIFAGLNLQDRFSAMVALELHWSKRGRSHSVQQGAAALWWTYRVLHKTGTISSSGVDSEETYS